MGSKEPISGGATRLVSFLLTAVVAAMPVYSHEAPPPQSPTAQMPQPQLSFEQQGHQHYSRGLYYRDKALGLEKRLAMATTDKARHKLSKKIIKNYRMATGEFEDALRSMPTLHQAATGLAHVLRKTGNYPESLKACRLALSIEPADGEAIACLAETHMAMGQLEDAKDTYLQLTEIDGARSSELLTAMQIWLRQQMLGPSEVPPSILEYFAEWLAEQSEI